MYVAADAALWNKREKSEDKKNFSKASRNSVFFHLPLMELTIPPIRVIGTVVPNKKCTARRIDSFNYWCQIVPCYSHAN